MDTKKTDRRDSVVLELKDGDNHYQVIGRIQRVPQGRAGWEFVSYQGKRYQLFGGVRGLFFIDVKHPLKSLKNRLGEYFVTVEGKKEYFTSATSAINFANDYFKKYGVVLGVEKKG